MTNDKYTTHPYPDTTSPVAEPPESLTEDSSFINPTVEPVPHSSTKTEGIRLKDPEVRDFGWNSEPKAVPSPLIYGIPNDDLYILIRRFNKVSSTCILYQLYQSLTAFSKYFTLE